MAFWIVYDIVIILDLHVEETILCAELTGDELERKRYNTLYKTYSTEVRICSKRNGRG